MALRLSVLLMFVVLLGCALHAQALTQISNCLELQAMKDNLSEDYELVNDIDCSDTVNWNGGAGFEPVGNDLAPFAGSLAGQGYQITGLVVNRPSTDYVGVLGYTSSIAAISSLGVLEGSVSGQTYVGGLVGRNAGGAFSNSYTTGSVTGLNHVGGLVGRNAGNISNSYATGDVFGSDQFTGGLAGFQDVGNIVQSYAAGDVSGSVHTGGLLGYQSTDGTIIQSYAIGKVTGSSDFAGGLVGFQGITASITQSYSRGRVSARSHVGGLLGWQGGGSIEQSYAIGSVSGTNNVGGLVGYQNSGAATQSYWDTQASGQTTSAAGIGRTTAQMKQQATFSGWDFSAVWYIKEGVDYPRLRATYIRTCEELQSIPLDADVVLANDIDCSDTVNWNGGAGFEPLGTATNRFVGTLDGRGHKIQNLFINRPSADSAGLFGRVSDAQISDVGLEEVDIVGGIEYVGGLAGTFIGVGVISRCYVSGSVSGSSHVGGLVGRHHASITQCYATASVSSVGDHVGGLVGTVDASSGSGEITDSYATGSVSGAARVGGLVGNNYQGVITHCYAAGSVSGSSETGGLIGSQNTATTTQSYWDTQTSGQTTSDGGTGLTTAQMQQQASFFGWDFSSVWWIKEAVDYPKLYSFGAPPPTASSSASQSMSFSKTVTESYTQSSSESASPSVSSSASQSMSFSQTATESRTQSSSESTSLSASPSASQSKSLTHSSTATPSPTVPPQKPPPFTPGDTIYADGAVLSMMLFPFDVHHVIVSTPKSNTQYYWALDGSDQSEIEGDFASFFPVHNWHLGAERDGQYELLGSLSFDEITISQALIYMLDSGGVVTLKQTLTDSATAMAYAQQGATDYIALSGGLEAPSTIYRRRSQDNHYLFYQTVEAAHFAVNVHAFEIEGEPILVFAVFQTETGGLRARSPILKLGTSGWEVWRTIDGNGVRHITSWQHKEGKKQQTYLLVAESSDSFGYELYCSIYTYSNGGFVLAQRDLLGRDARHWLLFTFQNIAYAVLSNHDGQADVYRWQKVKNGSFRIDASEIIQGIPTLSALRGYGFLLDDIQHLVFVQEGRDTLVTWLATKDSLPNNKHSGWEITNWQIILFVLGALSSILSIAYTYWRYRVRKRKEQRRSGGLISEGGAADDDSDDGFTTMLSRCWQFFTRKCRSCCTGRRASEEREYHNLEAL